MQGNYYNPGRQLRRTPTNAIVAKDSNFQLRKVAAALYSVTGCDATKEQIDGARKALLWYQEGKSMPLIILLLRIKPKVPPPTTIFEL